VTFSRHSTKKVSFAAELNDGVLIIRLNALSGDKAKLRQVFAVEVTFQNRARDLSGGYDYLLRSGPFGSMIIADYWNVQTATP
jgi:hypothetical protein